MNYWHTGVLIGVSLFGITATCAAELDASYAPAANQGAPTVPTLVRAAPPNAAIATLAPVLPEYAFEIGARYWYSSGKLAKDLYDDPRSAADLASRLTYSGLASHAFEGFGKLTLPSNLFLKGFAGVSGLHNGSLNDEDFPPGTVPYSSTKSAQNGGRLGYATADLGYGLVVNPNITVSMFGGYSYVSEKVNAYGCTQLVGNPDICVPAIGPGVLAISEQAHWRAVRLGVGVALKPFDRLMVSGEAAWLPVVQLRSQDTHWLRLGSDFGSFAGPIPETASGKGFQLEALLSYQVWDNFSIGLGGRYWRLNARGVGYLEQTVVGVTDPAAQPMKFVSERYGVFVQALYKFNL